MIERGNLLFAVTQVTSALKKFRDSGSEQIRTLLERHREQILADCQAEIQKHEFQADYDRSSQRRRYCWRFDRFHVNIWWNALHIW